MPALFYVDNKQYVADRIFTNKDLPSIMEVSGAFYYFATNKPVSDRAHLDWLPEPHKSRALLWFDSGHKPSETEYKTVQVETKVPENKLICALCPDTPEFKSTARKTAEQRLKEHTAKYH